MYFIHNTKNRVVSFDEPDTRPIKKGKEHPACEFGSRVQFYNNFLKDKL